MDPTTDGDGVPDVANATVVPIAAGAAVAPLLFATLALVLCATPVWPLTEAEPFAVVGGAASFGALTLLLTKEPVSYATAFLAAVLTVPVLTVALWFGSGTGVDFAYGGAAVASAALSGWAASRLFRGVSSGLLFVVLTALPPFAWILLEIGGASPLTCENAAAFAALSPVVAAARHAPVDLTFALIPALLLTAARFAVTRRHA